MNHASVLRPALMAAAIAFAALAPATLQAAPDASLDAMARSAVPAERGRYLVTVLGCNDCHTPWKEVPGGAEPDMSRMLSGHPQSLPMPPPPALPEGPWQGLTAITGTAFTGPWGVSFTANLTPDPETGLGKWTYENFRDTFRTGRRMGRGRPILPPMPIPMYRHLTDEDLSAVFAYLQTIPAISNQVPEPVVPDPAD
jgi:mono/diheme cytochrome c family protein